MAYFSIDGIEWNIPCDIERVSEVKSSSISGMLLNGEYFNDVIGQYLRYTVSLVIPKSAEDSYTALYEALSEPVARHTFVMPYGQGTLTVRGRVEQISDVYVRESSGFTWRRTKFEVISNTPYRRQALSGAINPDGGYVVDGGGDSLLSAAGMTF